VALFGGTITFISMDQGSILAEKVSACLMIARTCIEEGKPGKLNPMRVSAIGRICSGPRWSGLLVGGRRSGGAPECQRRCLARTLRDKRGLETYLDVHQPGDRATSLCMRGD